MNQEMSIELCCDEPRPAGPLIDALMDNDLAAQCLDIEQYRLRLLEVAIRLLLQGD